MRSAHRLCLIAAAAGGSEVTDNNQSKMSLIHRFVRQEGKMPVITSHQ